MATFYLDFVNGNDANAGTSWATAWKTITNGATAARIAPNDTIRIAKSADPTSIGNATWTNQSATVTLSTAKTANIYLDGAWTAANSGSTTTTTTRKEGANASQITTSGTTATTTKYAYYATGTLDLSSYDAITLWIRNISVAVSANNYQIKLCSDTTGDTAVDTFDIPAIASTTTWVPLTLTRIGGGNLGNSIKSIGWYTGSANPGNSRQVFLDDILACTNSGLNLTSLLSKNSAAYDGSDTWHGIQSINGTTVILANTNDLSAGDANLLGYYTNGTTPATVTSYVRPTIKFATMASAASTAIETLQDSGTAGNYITFSGGWNTSTNTQDGETWVDGQNGLGRFINFSTFEFNNFDRINGCRFNTLLNATAVTSVNDNKITYAIVTNSTIAFFNPGLRTIVSNLKVNNCTNFITSNSSSPTTGLLFVNTVVAKNCHGFGTVNGYSSRIDNLTVCNTLGFAFGGGGTYYLDNVVVDRCNGASTVFSTSASAFTYINSATITNNTNPTQLRNTYIKKLTASGNTNLLQSYNTYVNQMNAATTQLLGSSFTDVLGSIQPNVSFNNINNVSTDNRIYWLWGNALSQTTTRHTASGIAWQLNITNTGQNTTYPLYYPIAKVACNANTLVTIKAWVKLSHATDIGAKLMIQANEIAGVSADITATKSADTNWEELTITFTPTVAGVAQIYLQGYWLANLADESIFVDDITVTQA